MYVVLDFGGNVIEGDIIAVTNAEPKVDKPEAVYTEPPLEPSLQEVPHDVDVHTELAKRDVVVISQHDEDTLARRRYDIH